MSKRPEASPTRAHPIIIGENHADAAARRVLKDLVPTLKDAGYEFCLEFDSSKNFAETMSFFHEGIEISRQNIVTLNTYFQERAKEFSAKNYKEAVEIAHFYCDPNLRHMLSNDERYSAPQRDGAAEKSARLIGLFEDDLSKAQEFLQNFNNLKLIEGKLSSDQEMIELLAAIERHEMPYANIDMAFDRKVADSAETGRKMLAERDAFIADKLSPDRSRVVLLGIGHVLPRSSVAIRPIILIGDGHAQYFDQQDPLTPYNVELIDVTKTTHEEVVKNLAARIQTLNQMGVKAKSDKTTGVNL